MELVNFRGMTDKIISLCQSSTSPAEDVSLFKTGTIAWNFVMSDNIQRNIKCVRPEESSPFKYISGGHVFFDVPSIVGRHIVGRRIAIDHNSIYPSIIIAGNISPDFIVMNKIYKSSSSYSDEDSLLGNVIIDSNNEGMKTSLENNESVSI